MSDVKVSSLYVSVGLDLEKRDLAKVEKQVEQFTHKLEKEAVVHLRPSHASQREAMRREASLWRSEQIRKQKIHERMDAMRVSRFSRITRKVKGGFGAGLGGLGGMAAGIGGAALLQDALSFSKELSALDVASRGSMGSIDQVRSNVMDVSNELGVSKEQILAGSAAFVRLTGDGRTAAGAMRTFGRVAKATGSDIDDVAGTAAAMAQQLGIGAADMESAFSILIAGGKSGAIEMKDMAQFSAELASQFKLFEGGTGLRGLADMSAALQISAQAFGGKAPETATGLKALFSSFTSPRTLKALKGMGVEIFKIGKDGSAQLKSFPEIFEAMAKTDMVRDPRLLTKVFESSEARRAASAILGNVDAMSKLSKEISKAKDVSEDFAKVSESAAARAETAWNRAKNAASTAAGTAISAGLGVGEGIGTGAAYVADKLGLVDTTSEAQKSAEGGKFFADVDDAYLENIAATSAGAYADGAKRELRRRKREREKQSVYDATNRPDTGGFFNVERDANRTQAALVEQPVRYEAGAGGRGGLTTGNINVTVNATTTSDAHSIADMVTGKIRQALEASARDIAATSGRWAGNR